VELEKDYHTVDEFWKDSINKTFLIGKYKDEGALGFDYQYCLCKIANNDTITYSIRKSNECLNTRIFQDTLYFYSTTNSFVTDWYKKEYDSYQRVDYSRAFHDTVNIRKMQKLFGGVYKWNGKELIKISNDANDLFALLEKPDNEGLYYLPPPGIGVKLKYNLKYYSNKLAEAVKYKDYPNEL